MNLIINTYFLICVAFLCDADSKVSDPASAENVQSDVEAPAYRPAYLRNQKFSRAYSGTKNGNRYGGTKTVYTGTKTGYGGTKTGYGYTRGPPQRYSDVRSWHSHSGEAPSYNEFYHNANQDFAPKCEQPCQNNGICVDTNTCLCSPNYYGKYCEFEKKPCLSYPPLPMNSMRKCSSELCTITCMEGYKFYDGTTVANMRCVDGKWQPTRADITAIPDCQPECDPPCLNGGVCLGINTCQCPTEYRGHQCQYSTKVCDVRKLAFNGGYKCFGDGESFSCALNCPTGSTYSSPPADIYTCSYATGVFLPQPIPRCVFGDVVIITPGNHHQYTMYNTHTEQSSEEHTVQENNINKTLISASHTSHGYAFGGTGGGGAGGGHYAVNENNPVQIVVQDFSPKGGTCLSWAGFHYKTFDGKIYSFQSACQHILVRDPKEHKYTVAVKQGVCKSQTYCPSELTFYLEDKPYLLQVGDDGSVVFRTPRRLIPIPASLPGIRVSIPSDYVQVNLDTVGVTVKWDTNNMILIEGTVLIWNNTEGLCGRLDGDIENDLTTKEGNLALTKSVLASSWQMNKFGDVCESNPTETSACASKSDEEMKKALQFCTKIFSKPKFHKCSKVMDVSLLLEACQWDYCACTQNLSPEECACSTVSVYAKECIRHGVEEMKNWRDADTCPMKCSDGKLYRSCGPESQPCCAFPLVPARSDNATCVEGCFCPEGLLMENGRCVQKTECPCRLRNKSFKPGTTIPKDCNTCTCQAGEWTCTQVPCGARCGAIGDPHYTTFDGLRYDFMGHCTYTLLSTENITVEVENVACSGTITEAMKLSPYKGEGKPSCTKAVSLIHGPTNIHLKQGGLILVNGKEITTLPVIVGGVRIRAASSLFLIVQLPNKVDLWWDGNTRVFVDVPPEFHDKTKGLCGTFNLNQKDDFLTPENDIEQSALAFANKWKTRELCSDVDIKEPEHPCKANVENKQAAEKYCSMLKSKLFEECHWHVDVEHYYEWCVYDMCACAGDVSRCLCPIFGDYAMACAKAGVILQWRYNVKECELTCTGGQEYTVCADSCVRKCSDTALVANGGCRPTCVEGCACPSGQLLDDNGVCVPVGMCPCYHKGLQFNAGYKEVRAGSRERELCTCVGASWDCTPATPEDIQNYRPAEDLRSNCSAASNMEFTTCEIAEPLTCKNMHLPLTSTSTECRPGCQCKKGFVLDMVSKKCVQATECPCHHGGRSYPDGFIMQEECNKCECKSGNWSCTRSKCAGICTAWGDSHIITFDGSDYDFEGVCTYLLAKGVMDSNDGFDVEIQNVPCGTTGATCSKSVTLKVGANGNEEIVSLTKSAPVPDISKLKRIKMREAGAYVFLDVPTLGMSLQWDRAMRVYVKVDSMWQGRVKGLCGNYNADMRDDFQTPSGGGIAESSALIFADSWKLKSTCPKPTKIIDHCKQRPERVEWAIGICGAMKRYPFTLCHSEVPPGIFVTRCERDACACDSGDDCHCACAALAAYAYACAARGVTFSWRSQELCPMQCDEECSNYQPCVPACPPETCDNTLYYTEMKTNCEQETCVEGCKPKKSCPEGTVYKNSSLADCVPRAKCKPVCMVLEDGREVLEGEIIEEDACHTCRCSKKHRVCSGQPCSTEGPHIGSMEPSTEKPHDEPLKCTTGWTEWVNRGPPEIGPNGESIDNEPLPKPYELQIGTPMCKPNMMTKVECRTVNGHKTPKETGLDVECSLERGLVCKEVGKTCPDFEIRVYCECEEIDVCKNTTRPIEPHPTDCTKYYECAPHGAVIKECGPGTMYNPVAMVCDWPGTVVDIRPECKISSISIPKTEIITTMSPTIVTYATTNSQCPPGMVFKDCAFPCDKLCDYFKKTLQDKERCLRENCVEGCVDQSVANIKCDYGSYWRDEKTCVPLRDCTCFNDGQIIKPGGVVVDGCLKCQCIDNKVHCDNTDCVSIIIPSQGSTHSSYIFPTPQSTTTAKTTVRVVPSATPSTTSTTSTTPTTPTTTTIVTTPTTLLIIKTTVSPPPECAPDRYIDLMWGDQPLPDSAFSASSYASEFFAPQNAVLNGRPKNTTAGSWSPSTKDKEPYIQVELPRREPIYGVIMQGSPLLDQYVTSYSVLYGDDGTTFSTVDGPDGHPKVFRGPVDSENPMKQMIEPPIEAKVVRIKPLTWHDNASIRFELIGCQKPTEVTEKTTVGVTIEPLECTEPLGLTSDIPLSSIQVSSNSEARKFLNLSDDKGWTPLYSTPGEWIMFDFQSPRNLTGIKTKGGANGWVTTYKVFYTSDLSTFNPVLDNERKDKVFPANFDKHTEVTSKFKPAIRAQYLKIVPVSWHNKINIRIEPIGCYEPYEIIETTTVPIIGTPAACLLCPGVEPGICACLAPNNYFDGENCVSREQCPCVESFMTYPVGSTFRGANCDECLCKLGGNADCKPIKECKCENSELVPKLSPSTCECLCESCPPGKHICETSKICLADELWCDGVQDCPDDELDCTTKWTTVTEAPAVTTKVPTAAATKATTPATTTSTTAKPVECPKVECPPGYFVRYISSTSSSYSRSSTSDLPAPRPRVSYQRYYRGGYSKGGYSKGGYSKGGYSKGGYSKGGFSKGGYGFSSIPQQNQAFVLHKPGLEKTKENSKQECAQFKCIPKLPPPFKPGSTPAPVICSVTTCPPGYTLKLETVPIGVNKCPQYECLPPPERPAFCNVTGRTFNTFDGTEYKYDACYHILARENKFDAWTVILRKNCQENSCRNELVIIQDDQQIVVKSDLMILYNNYEYTIEQTKKICFEKNSFDVDKVGNAVLIKSRKYKFMVLFTKEGDIKIAVSKSYMGSVDGMCGAFDGNPRTDRQLPDGSLARSIDDFGRAWAKPGLTADACVPKVVPPSKQKIVWDLCSAITKDPLSECGKVLNLNKWHHICLEKVCECTDLIVNGTKRTEEECRCLVLEQMVAECLAADKDINVDTWRIMMDCPADCPSPLVHYDCYRKRCEPTCSPYSTAQHICPVEDGQCFPGCYCPEGKLRNGDQCVVPADCLDCACTGVGTPAEYTTFEGDDLPFLSNCTYLASQDSNATDEHAYQVFATNGPCEDNVEITCTKNVHLVYEKNLIQITKDPVTKKLVTTIGETAVYKYPVKKDWGTISLLNGQDVSVTLPDIHVELTVFQNKMRFSVRVPSYLYRNRTEGLCGVCASSQDHLVTSNGTVTDDFNLYGKSWQAGPEALKALRIPPQEQCTEPPPPEECTLPPPESNPCYNLFNADKFGQCHALVDPQSFVESCEVELCANISDVCPSLERYVAACRAQGVCFDDWRLGLCPYPCEAPFVYRSCVDCERTCENNEDLETYPEKCTNKPVEGCFCPEGKVRVNNTCIEPSKCFPCDANNVHFAGDEWKEDACTSCTCSKVSGQNAAHVSCTTQHCSAPLCSDLEDMVVKPPLPGRCCPEYSCVPKPQVNCEEPKKMVCGFGQVLKQKTTPNGCKEYACECMPPSECEQILSDTEVEVMEPGMERLVDNSGCCPRVEFICRPENCPQPPVCQQFHDLKTKNISGKCCPEFSCELPKDKCIVKLEWEAAAKGGEKSRPFAQVLLKDTGAVWLDGPCRSCKCEVTAGGASPSCSVTECAPVTSTDQFVLEPRPVPFACCPQPVQVACRDGDNIYKVGENWTSPNDACEKYQCVQGDDGQLQKVTRVEHCDTDCQPGWMYFAAEPETGECCGKCKPVACIVDGEERPIGEKWTSTDFCANFTCVNLNGTLQVQSSNETCPEVSAALKKQFVIDEEKVPGKCCPKQVFTACRFGDKVYKVGEKWKSPIKVCENYQCATTEEGKLEKITTVQHCDDECQPGWEYFPAETGSGECCGKCKPVACIIDGIERPIGDKWTSMDFCTNFTCVDLNGTLQVQSSDETCPEVSAAMRKEYVLSDEKIPGKCCPKEEPIACRVGNLIYQEGQTWTSSDPCKNLTCSRDLTGRLTHSESVERCSRDCKRGWKYSEPEPGVCCGRCVQAACVVEDKVMQPGTTWTSADNCTTFSCDSVGEEVFVTSSREQCPNIADCNPEYIVNDTCCQICKEPPQAQSKCTPKSIPHSETVGLIRVHLGKHGLCVNKGVIKGFKECRGTCDSGTLYNNQTGSHDTQCECCSATRYSGVSAILKCEDGTRQRHQVASPVACACQLCGTPPTEPVIPPTKNVYSGTKTEGTNRDREEYEVPDIYRRFGEDVEKPRLR